MFGTEPVEIRVRAIGDWGKSSFVTLIATVEGSRYIYLRDGPFDIQGGWNFFAKFFLFPTGAKKMYSTKLKIKICSSFSEFFRSPFPSEL